MELNRELIGNRIKSERIDMKLTQEDLAIKLGLNNKSSISQYEKGDAIPSDDIKLKMCQIFNCSIDYLLGKSDIRNSEKKEQDLLNLAKVGFTKENYNPPTDKQKEQIKTILETILEDNKKK